MKQRLFVLLSLLIILSLALTSAAFGQTPTTAPDRPARNLQEIPAEIQALFKDGMPISEFLARNQGPVPRALAEFSNERVTVIVQMEGEPLAAVYSAAQQSRRPLSADAQQQHVTALREAQAPVVASLVGMGGSVISQYTKAYNGILVNLPASHLAEVQRLPGVKAIRRAPLHHIDLANSVPLIRADEVVNSLGYDGSGISIAVIDTGIDYFHAAFGGSGNPADYAGNDPNVIEPGTFPTMKVVGGYDFAGTNYDAGSSSPAEYTPFPDDDPLDEHGHGTHVASTAAGIGSTDIGVGVAPGADLYALKVFGAAGSTNLTVDAIEWAMDPNGDTNLDDHVDVINMSLGSDYGPNDVTDPDIIASNMASSIGVVVVSSAGNAGDTPYITGSPAAADSVISVAASTTGFISGPTVSVQPGGTPVAIYQPSDFDGNTGHYTTTITAPLFNAGTLSVPDTLCDITGVPTNAMAGDIALIQRGTCDFTTKVNNAGTLGAVGAIIFNHATGGDGVFTMVGLPVTIPAGFIGHTDGVALSAHHGENVEVLAENLVTTIPDANVDPDTIASFSSRGPRGFDSVLKPEISAPGVAIVAAKMGGGQAGLSLNGTSMASPHVAGVAALVKDAHPTWTPEQVKAAMMNSAVDLADLFSTQTPLQGAGRVDAYESVSADGFLVGDPDLVSLNWGLLSLTSDSYATTKNLELENLTGSSKVYSVTWDFASGSLFSGFDMTLPPTVSVGAGPSATTIPVGLALDTTQMITDFGGLLEEYYGYITLTNNTVVTDTLRIPFYGVVEPYAELSLAGTVSGINSGEVEITHSGPITSSLWAYPLLATDVNEPAVGDEGDLRMVGMDYGWNDATYGDMFVPAFNTWGAWHTPQPYFAEIDLDFDLDGDTVVDLTDFNYNLGWWNGGDDTDQWYVIQIDWNLGLLFLGSPYPIYSDYNAGFMEWYLPAGYHYLDASGDTDFDFEAYSFDYEGNGDFGGGGSFDYTMMPFMWDFTTFDPGPGDNVSTLSYQVYDPAGYTLSAPLGMMVVDYNGQGGAGQAYSYEFTLDSPFQIILPLMQKDS